MTPLRFTILGQAQSKSNSRKAALVGPAGNKRQLWIKSDEARAFEEGMLRQIPPACRIRLRGPCWIKLKIFYRTELPDLDETLILDCLQDRFALQEIRGQKKKKRVLVQPGVVQNDRQFRWRLAIHGIDRVNPRVEIELGTIAGDELIEPEAPLPF